MRKVLIAMVVAVLAAATVARADAKIAVVDVQRVIDDSEKGKQARELLKQKFEQEKAALEKEGKEISVLKEDLDISLIDNAITIKGHSAREEKDLILKAYKDLLRALRPSLAKGDKEMIRLAWLQG